jgi:hypothetical protein
MSGRLEAAGRGKLVMPDDARSLRAGSMRARCSLGMAPIRAAAEPRPPRDQTAPRALT